MQDKIARRLARFRHRKTVPLRPGRCVVSFSFDDVPASACTVAADMIATASGRATYYVCGGFENMPRNSEHFFSSQQLRELVSAGHEVGCHGFGHLDYQRVSSSEIERDLASNRAYFAEIGIPKARHFAYPYGCVNPSVKQLCAKHFESCRGVQRKIHRRSVDLNLLCAVPMYSSKLSHADVDALLSKLTTAGGWLVFLGHGVLNDPKPFDATPELLGYVIKQVNSRGFPILTISDALSWLSCDGKASMNSCD